MKILVSLPRDRNYYGQLSLEDDDGDVVLGPFPADGKSDSQQALEVGNPNRDPIKPFGDTPIGEYSASVSYKENTFENRHAYGEPNATGAIPTIDLDPIEGNTQAWQAKLNGRLGLKIHSGAMRPDGKLRPTHGCVRLSNKDMGTLLGSLAGIQTFKVSIQEKAQLS